MIDNLDERADELIDVLQLKFHNPGKQWSDARYPTTWGTKTRLGLREVIKRIMTDETHNPKENS